MYILFYIHFTSWQDFLYLIKFWVHFGALLRVPGPAAPRPLTLGPVATLAATRTQRPTGQFNARRTACSRACSPATASTAARLPHARGCEMVRKWPCYTAVTLKRRCDYLKVTGERRTRQWRGGLPERRRERKSDQAEPTRHGEEGKWVEKKLQLTTNLLGCSMRSGKARRRRKRR
jgi:hypothetical protein